MAPSRGMLALVSTAALFSSAPRSPSGRRSFATAVNGIIRSLPIPASE